MTQEKCPIAAFAALNSADEAALILERYMDDKGIEFAFTGTYALATIGLLPNDYIIGDLDVLCNKLTDEQKAGLAELEKLSGIKSSAYPDTKTWTFMIKGVKVNVMFTNEPIKTICLYGPVHKLVSKVQVPLHALKAKMALKRNKDYQFFNSLMTKLYEEIAEVQ